MGIFRSTTSDKINLFRKHFTTLTADGTFPPEQQERLFRWCRRVGLDWDVACKAVQPDAVRIMRHQLEQIVADRRATVDEIAELRRLQRRLGLPDDAPVLHQFNALVAQKLSERILERSPYLASAEAAASLRSEILLFGLPTAIEQALLEKLDRQHRLAELTGGLLPVFPPSVSLYTGEACHHEAAVSFLASENDRLSSGEGLMVVTSQRVLLLSPSGGYTARWIDIRRIRYRGRNCCEFTIPNKIISVTHPDAQYLTTLLIGAHRTYAQRAPVAIRSSKQLESL